jgi:hypothetical protein
MRALGKRFGVDYEAIPVHPAPKPPEKGKATQKGML